jgi:hypothetical protein
MEDSFVKSFDNIEDMFSYLDGQRQEAKKLADQYNAKEVIPRYKYWALNEASLDLVIIGKRWEPSANPTPEELEDVESVNGAMENGWIFARWYSFACPEGELGDNHISRCFPIPEFIFNFCLEHIQGE